MTTRIGRRRVTLVLVAFLPTLTALLVLRPAPARGQGPTVGFFALTVTAASATTSGDIGAGGGLTPIDTGAPVVKGRLDSSPTASMIAAAVEPGTLYRTGAALANNEAGGEVVPVEFAEAAHPGGPAEDQSDPTATGVEGPVTSRTAQADARATERAISGTARVAEQSLGPAEQDVVMRQRGGHAEAAATADPVAGTLVATAASTAETITVGGVVTFEDVSGHAVVRLEDGQPTAEAGTTYGGITVADVPVAVTTDGVVVADDAPLLPGQEVAGLEDQVNAVLEAAGIRITSIAPVESADGGSATADSGGVRVAITSPSSAAVPANVVEVVVGQAVATLTAEPPMPPPAPLPTSAPPDLAVPATGPQPTSTPTSPPPPATAPRAGTPVTVAPVTPTTTTAPPPSVAAPAPAAPEPPVVLAGRRIPRRTALALFGGWQLVSLSTCTLAAFALRGGRSLP